MTALSYHGPADLVLRYGEPPHLTRTAERSGIELRVSCPALGEPFLVLVGPGLHLDLAKAPTSARLQLPDGTVIAGRVSQEDCNYGTFLILPGC